MDEPLSNLDAKLRVQMRADIASMQADLGVTTVYVTHDQSEAMTLGDRVAALKDGFLQQMRYPRELYDRPVNTFVAGFIGSPAMNLCEVPVENGAVSFGAVSVPVPRGANGNAGVILGLRPRRSSWCPTGCPPKSRSSRNSARTRSRFASLMCAARGRSSSRGSTLGALRRAVTGFSPRPNPAEAHCFDPESGVRLSD